MHARNAWTMFIHCCLDAALRFVVVDPRCCSPSGWPLPSEPIDDDTDRVRGCRNQLPTTVSFAIRSKSVPLLQLSEQLESEGQRSNEDTLDYNCPLMLDDALKLEAYMQSEMYA